MRNWKLLPNTQKCRWWCVNSGFFHHADWTLNIQKNFFLTPKWKIWMNLNFEFQYSTKRKIKFSVSAIKFRSEKFLPEDPFAFEQKLFYCSKRKIYKSFMRFMNVLGGEKKAGQRFHLWPLAFIEQRNINNIYQNTI